jgi:predicted transcriptional regulator
MVFYATFINISVILWQSVLLEETGVLDSADRGRSIIRVMNMIFQNAGVG